MVLTGCIFFNEHYGQKVKKREHRRMMSDKHVQTSWNRGKGCTRVGSAHRRVGGNKKMGRYVTEGGGWVGRGRSKFRNMRDTVLFRRVFGEFRAANVGSFKGSNGGRNISRR